MGYGQWIGESASGRPSELWTGLLEMPRQYGCDGVRDLRFEVSTAPLASTSI